MSGQKVLKDQMVGLWDCYYNAAKMDRGGGG